MCVKCDLGHPEACDNATDGCETLWRCERCGKWSHAKSKPLRHERFISSQEITCGDWDFEVGDTINVGIVTRIVPGYQTAVDDFDPGGVFVACGPFAEYRAVQVNA